MAGVLLLSALVLAYQAIIITPTTAGTVDQSTKAQVSDTASDVVTAAHERGAVAPLLRYWNVSARNGTGDFAVPPGEGGYAGTGYRYRDPPGLFGRLLGETFADEGYVYNVALEHRDPAAPEETRRTTLLKRGEPTGNAVAVSLTVTLYDGMRVTEYDESTERLVADADGATLAGLGEDFYAGNLDGPVYNVVTVEVVVW